MSISDPTTNELSEINNPDWDYDGKCHNWRHYVPGEYQALWFGLSRETRFCIYFIAQEQADKEEWD